MIAYPTDVVDRATAPLPPPPWSEILGPFADQLPFPTTCGCTVYRRRGVDLSVYYVGHETYVCALGRSDADLAVHPADPVAVPRLMLASTLWWTHVDVVYAVIRAARTAVIA